ncbi:MAG: 4'-phosphopantetheinyl transferase family protein [Nitrospiraceae bacterium]
MSSRQMISEPSQNRPPSQPYQITSTDVHVWQASLALPEPQIVQLERILSDDERMRASRFVFPCDRIRFIAAHGILRTLVGLYERLAPSTLVFRSGAQGKPFLHNPSNISGRLQFNLSHSHELGLFAFAREREVGVDLEALRDDVEAMALAARFFSTTEFERLRQQPPHEAKRLFFVYWTCKESYLKGRGSGLSVPLSQCEISLVSGKARVNVSGRDACNPWLIRTLSVKPGYVGSVAAEGENWDVTYQEWPRDDGWAIATLS